MTMAIIAALVQTIFSQRVFGTDLMFMRIDLVSVDVTVWMRFFCHIPQAFGAHEKHCDGE